MRAWTGCGSRAENRSCARTSPTSFACSPAGRPSRTLRSRRTACCSPTKRRALRAAGLHRLTVSLDTLRGRSLPRAHPLRRVGRGPRGHRGGDRGGVHRPQARHRRHPRRERRRAPRTAGVCGVGRCRGALHRIHGRRRRHPLVDARRREPRRDAAGHRRRARTRRSRRRADVGPGGSLPVAGRSDVRHHLVDHRAVLPHVRPEPPHPQTASGTAVSTPGRAPTSGSGCEPARHGRNWGISSAPSGPSGAIEVRSCGSRRATASLSFPSRRCSGSRTSRCTRGAARSLRHRTVQTPSRVGWAPGGAVRRRMVG